MLSDNISVYEQYLFATDKKEFLDSCKNSSHVKQYIRLCHLLNEPDTTLEQVDRDVLNNWHLHSPHGDKLNLILKDKIIAILNEKDDEKKKKLLEDFNSKYLKFTFYDSRQVAGSQSTNTNVSGAQTSLKTALNDDDYKEMATLTKIQIVEDTEGNLPFAISELGYNNAKSVNLERIKHLPILEQLFHFVDNFSSFEVFI